MIVLSVALFLLLLAGIGLRTRSWLLGRGRSQALAGLCADRGLTYVPRDDRQVRPLGHPFGIGRNRRAENVLFGRVRGREVVAFDYVFGLRQVGFGWRTERYAVVVVHLPAALPELELVEEGPDDKPDTFLGLDFVVTDDPFFNERFRVRAADRSLAQELLSPWTQKELLQRPPLRLRILGDEAVSWRRGRLRPRDLDEHLGSISALVDGIPPTVWMDYRSSGY